MHRLAAAIALTSLSACIDTDAAVFVEPSIDEASAAISGSQLAGGLEGRFRARLHLGPRASGQSEVALRSLSVQNADRTATLVATLKASADPTFPVTVPVDGDVNVQATFAADDNLLEPDAVDALCSAGGIRIVGTFEGSLRGGSVTAASEPFEPTGCP